MTRLAVFDCDGTLLDSQANILRAMASAFAAAGLGPPPAERVRRIVGLSLPEAMAALLPDAGAELHASLSDDYRHAFHRMRSDRSLDPEPLFDGLADLLDDLGRSGWLLAVATGKSDRGLKLALEAHAIQDRFISLQTADRHPSKPHPSMLLQCLSDAGVPAHHACIIGDTVCDVGMGVAAGVMALGVDWGYHDALELIGAGAAAVAKDAAELKALLHG
jgi:phosphoglycolate phosphatase